MIGIPFNDLSCLGAITEQIAARVEARDPELVQIAATHPTTAALAEWIRGLPQRDDDGLRDDGPKVHACRPAQRLRVPTDDPNCVERSALYLAAAELIDPWPVRRLATLDLPFGRHTFPIEEGAPVVLDPKTTQDELAHGLGAHIPEAPLAPPAMPSSDEVAPAARHPVAIDIDDAIRYTIELAQAGAASVRNGRSRASAARNAIRELVEDGKPPADPQTIDAIAWFLETAKDVAQHHGLRALTIVRTTALAIADLADDIVARQQRQPRNLSVEVNGRSYAIPSWVSGLGSLVGRIGLDVGSVALAPSLAPKLAAMGITGQMFDLVKEELAKDGYHLGPLDRPVQSFTSALGSIQKRST
jgi:hypothetical protein